jgi:hypothetical protein
MQEFKHAGLFYHHPLAYSIGEAIQKVMTACEKFSAEEMKNQVKLL